MKSHNELSLKEAIELWLNQHRDRNKYLQARIIPIWESIVGPLISKETESIFIKNHIMFVKLRSPALKNELEYAKKKLVTSINKKADNIFIDDIIFT